MIENMCGEPPTLRISVRYWRASSIFGGWGRWGVSGVPDGEGPGLEDLDLDLASVGRSRRPELVLVEFFVQ